MSDQARGRLMDWEKQVLDPSLDRFVLAAQAHLAQDLARGKPNGRLSAEAYDDRLTRWRRRALAERASAWESEHRVVIDGFARDLSERLADALAATVEEVGRAGAKAVGVARPASAGAEKAPWRRPVPPFEPSIADAQEAGEDAVGLLPFLPGPGVLGRRVARWLAARACRARWRRPPNGCGSEPATISRPASVRWTSLPSVAIAGERERLGLSPRPAAQQLLRAVGIRSRGAVGRIWQCAVSATGDAVH